MVSFADELLAKQGKIMGGILNRGAQELQGRLVAEARKVEARVKGSKVLPPLGPKEFEKAAEKVKNEYKGHWLDIKDMARCTFVVPFSNLLEQAVYELRAQFRSSNGFTVIQVKPTESLSNEPGYSGLAIYVASGGHKGEVQVNTQALMYGKSLHEFMGTFADRFDLMKATYPWVAPGLGHALYEVWRKPATPPDVKRKYAHASRLCYNYFRSYPPNMTWGIAAAEAVEALGFGRVKPRL